MGLEREVGRIGGPTFFFFFFFCIASRFNEAFLNFSSACRSIESERGGEGGRETRSIPHQRRNS